MNIQKEINKKFALQKEYNGTDKQVNKIDPVVSVYVVTYQHAPYIKECLDSILNQKVNFDFELILGEDDSNDGTREICISYADKYPDKIRLFLRDRKNSHIYDRKGKSIKRLNATFCRMSARGKYIAICEGDDYWNNNDKLQRQVDFLEQNPEYSGTYHDTLVTYVNPEKNHLFYQGNLPDFINAEDTIATGSPFHTSSFLFRRSAMILPNFFSKLVYGDMGLFSIIASYGKLAKLNGLLSVYRRHPGGITATTIIRNPSKRIELINFLNEYHNFKYDKKAKQVIAHHREQKKAIDREKRSAYTSIPKKYINKVVLKLKHILKK